jgi:hypothetical protein
VTAHAHSPWALRRLLAWIPTVAMALLLSACGSDSSSGGGGVVTTPTGPNTPTTPTVSYTVTGVVVDATSGTVISGATVRVTDGPDVNKSALTDGVGRYTLTGLQFAGFSVAASATNYVGQSRGVTLTSGATTSTVDFQLARSTPAPSAARTVTGTWRGTWSTFNFTMTLTQSGNTVTGTYSDQDGTGRTDPAAPGTFIDPNLNVRMKQAAFGDFTFTGVLDSTNNRVTGVVTAAGGRAGFTMDRQ